MKDQAIEYKQTMYHDAVFAGLDDQTHRDFTELVHRVSEVN